MGCIVRLKKSGRLKRDWTELHKIELSELLNSTNLSYLLHNSEFSDVGRLGPSENIVRVSQQEQQSRVKEAAAQSFLGLLSKTNKISICEVRPSLSPEGQRRVESVLGCLGWENTKFSTLDSFVLRAPSTHQIKEMSRSFSTKMSPLLANLRSKSYGDRLRLNKVERQDLIAEPPTITQPTVCGHSTSVLGSGIKSQQALDGLIAQGVLYFDTNFNAVSSLRTRIVA